MRKNMPTCTQLTEVSRGSESCVVHEHSNGDCVVPVQSEASLNVLLHLLTSVCDDHWVSGPCLIATSESHDVTSSLKITQLRRL